MEYNMISKRLHLLILILLIPWLGACSMGQMVARSSASILDSGVDAMNRETDTELAASAIPANLKLVEGLIVEDPSNTRLLENAAQGFYGYAYGFVELEDPPRAVELYQRCFDYGARALRLRGVNIDLADAGPDEVDSAVKRLRRTAVPALFWTASCQAKQIDMNREDPALIAQLANSERMMNRIMELYPDFYYGGAQMFYGVYYGSRAPMLGGDYDRAEEYFSQAREVTGGKLLLTDVLQAQYLERQRFDREAFRQLLTSVINTPVGSFPEMELVNQIARERARFLLDQEEEWF
jgi:hypothetical protein